MGINYSQAPGTGVYITDLSNLGMTAVSKEAEVCWGCHANRNSSTPLEFDDGGLNYQEGHLNQTKWVDGTTWATWESTNFANYKTNLDLHSTHDVGETSTYPVDSSLMTNTDKQTDTDKFRCSWCHDVHGVLDANTTGPYPRKNATLGYSGGATVTWSDDTKVFLRGIYYSSPYWEDGAPGVGSGNNTGGFTHPANSERYVDGEGGAGGTASGTWGGSGSWDADPAVGDLVGPNHLVRLQGNSSIVDRGIDDTDWPSHKWGAHLDDNVYGTTGYHGHNPTTNNDTTTNGATLNTPNHIDYSVSLTETLCGKCHFRTDSPANAQADLLDLWSGHGAASGIPAQNDIYTGNMAVNQHFMYNRWETDFTGTDPSDTGYAGELTSDFGWGTGSYYNWAVNLVNQTAAGQAVDSEANMLQINAGGSLDADTAFTQKYHQFTCSKCHSPHASANARLMITNCMNRDGIGTSGNDTFNMREGGPASSGPIFSGGTVATAFTNIIGATYPEPQNDGGREVNDPWIDTYGGQVRAVHCHNNMTPGQGGTGTFWQSIQ
jgi:hypothetical protein